MWKGPLVDGVTQSLLNKFLECKYSFYLYAILGLREEEEATQGNLIWGDIYHKGLEFYIEHGYFEDAVEGMLAYAQTQYPKRPKSYDITTRKMLWLYKLKKFKGDWLTEEIIDTRLKVRGYDFRVRGKRDGVVYNEPDCGTVLAEHKCKGWFSYEELDAELQYDLQVNLYLKTMPTPCEWVFYDIIRIPEAQKYRPKLQLGETDEAYWERLFSGTGGVGSYNNNYPIYVFPSQWIHQGEYHISLEQQETYFERTIAPLLLLVQEWYEYVTDSSFDWENPDCYGPQFFQMPIRHFSARRAATFKPDYYDYLVGNKSLHHLSRVSSYFGELEDQ